MGDLSHWTVKYHLGLIYRLFKIETIRGPGIKNTRAAVIYLAYEQRRLTYPYRERPDEPNGVADW
jgi:hypothetical protein